MTLRSLGWFVWLRQWPTRLDAMRALLGER
jgi:hypothetical protein